VPSLPRVELFRDRQAKGPRCEVDGYQSGDVGSREVVAGDKGDIGEPGFEIGIEVHDAEPAALGDPEAEVLIEDIRIMSRERFAGWVENQPRDVDPNRP
jgi:hypothetical protein